MANEKQYRVSAIPAEGVGQYFRAGFRWTTEPQTVTVRDLSDEEWNEQAKARGVNVEDAGQLAQFKRDYRFDEPYVVTRDAFDLLRRDARIKVDGAENLGASAADPVSLAQRTGRPGPSEFGEKQQTTEGYARIGAREAAQQQGESSGSSDASSEHTSARRTRRE